MPSKIAAVLFDLDGTLADTAPDMIAALNRLRAEQGLAPVADAAMRTAVSHGGRAILARAFPETDEAAIVAMIPRYLEIYAAALHDETALFPGMAETLAEIERRDIAWGIVTNKPGWLAQPLLDALALSQRCAILVCGDTLPVRKPDPMPVLHALSVMGVDAAHSLFVGDDLRDVQAGRAAGTATVIAAYGYVESAAALAEWGADYVIEQATDLLALLPAR